MQRNRGGVFFKTGIRVTSLKKTHSDPCPLTSVPIPKYRHTPRSGPHESIFTAQQARKIMFKEKIISAGLILTALYLD